MLSTRELFAKHQLRCTRQRMLVYDVLRETACHPTAEELHRQVEDETGRVSLATVYNSLDALEDAGLIRRIATRTGSARFDADTSPHPHVDLTDTDEVLDVPGGLGDELNAGLPADVLARIEDELGIEIDSVAIRIRGRRRN